MWTLQDRVGFWDIGAQEGDDFRWTSRERGIYLYRGSKPSKLSRERTGDDTDALAVQTDVNSTANRAGERASERIGTAAARAILYYLSCSLSAPSVIPFKLYVLCIALCVCMYISVGATFESIYSVFEGERPSRSCTASSFEYKRETNVLSLWLLLSKLWPNPTHIPKPLDVCRRGKPSDALYSLRLRAPTKPLLSPVDVSQEARTWAGL